MSRNQYSEFTQSHVAKARFPLVSGLRHYVGYWH